MIEKIHDSIDFFYSLEDTRDKDASFISPVTIAYGSDKPMVPPRAFIKYEPDKYRHFQQNFTEATLSHSFVKNGDEIDYGIFEEPSTLKPYIEYLEGIQIQYVMY